MVGSQSLSPAIELINGRFQRMKIKGRHIQTYTGLSGDEIQEGLAVVGHGIDDNSVLVDWSSKKVQECKKFKQFLERHCRATHYTFQIRKCKHVDCGYCQLNPPRVPQAVLDELHWLPDPMPSAAESGAFQAFTEVNNSCM